MQKRQKCQMATFIYNHSVFLKKFYALFFFFFFKISFNFTPNVLNDSIAFEKKETCTGRQKITTLYKQTVLVTDEKIHNRSDV
jgi:hypothetical protein